MGQGSEERGQARATGFDITVSSEIMAVLALATDLADMRERLGRMVVGNDTQGGAREGGLRGRGFTAVDERTLLARACPGAERGGRWEKSCERQKETRAVDVPQ